MKSLNLCVWIVAGGLAGPSLAAVINVPADQPTIQDAINAAVNGDEIVVAPGTYAESIDLGAKAIVVRGSSGDPSDTTIDGGGALHAVLVGFTTGARIEGFTITGGSATGGPGPDSWGGGMLNNGGRLEVVNCVFFANTATTFGGGLANFGNIVVVNCLFCGNSVNGTNAAGGGAYNGVYASYVNCAFSGNTASGSGAAGGGANGGGTDAYQNCSFSQNTAPAGGGLRVQGTSSVQDSLFRDNTPDDVLHDPISEVMLFNCFAATIAGTGNCACFSTFGGDPMFADPDGADNVLGTPDDDLRLSAGSLAIDNAITRVLSETDLGGDMRVAGLTADMGAYEFGSGPPAGGTCPSDATGDGVVDVVDLLALLGAWGACP